MVLFVAGVYGVGKSTLCAELSRALSLPAFSSGDLISAVNGEQYGANKVVSDKNANQDILIEAVNRMTETQGPIILAGHFCIFDKNNGVDILPDAVFMDMEIDKILLLEAEIKRIIQNLSNRDSKAYSANEIERLQIAELQQARYISEKIGVPLYQYNMRFEGEDLDNVLQLIGGKTDESIT